MGGSGLDRTVNFQKFCRQDWIGFNFCGSGLELGLQNFTVRSSLK